MTDKIAPVFVDSSSRLPLLNNHGRDFMGLENSSSPELVEHVKNLFEYLDEHLGFVNSAEGRENQKHFNLLLRSIYPEVMIDLADLVYAQHERLAVYLSFDPININLKKNFFGNADSLQNINQKITHQFNQIAATIAKKPILR